MAHEQVSNQCELCRHPFDESEFVWVMKLATLTNDQLRSYHVRKHNMRVRYSGGNKVALCRNCVRCITDNMCNR